MGAKAAVSLAEYLHTSYDNPDREYRDGEVVERTMPTWDHAMVQRALILVMAKSGLIALPELRLRMSESRVVIPDVCVFPPGFAGTPVPATPPLIAIEILSPDDRMKDVRQKLADFHAWGVTHVWLVDPELRVLYRYSEDGLHEVKAWALAEFQLELTAAHLFA